MDQKLKICGCIIGHCIQIHSGLGLYTKSLIMHGYHSRNICFLKKIITLKITNDVIQSTIESAGIVLFKSRSKKKWK